MSDGAAPRATEIRVKQAEKALEVDFDDGRSFRYPAEFLRVFSPSAEVQGHSPADRQLVHGRRHVGIVEVEPVGNYAIRITFDDMHETGIYSWRTLHDYGVEMDTMWADYLAELEAKDLSRDP